MKTLLFWKGRKKGTIHTRDITLDHFRYIFFPKGFHEKYGYLGSVPYENDDRVYKEVNKQSITNTFEETCKKFEV